MAYSPSRRQNQNNPAHPYTQHRPFEPQPYISEFGNRPHSQYSPEISSPRLNAQSEYRRDQRAHFQGDLKVKLETVLRHNSELLNENGTLSEMVNSLRLENAALRLAEKAISQDLSLQIANRQLQETLEAMRHSQIMHQKQIERLLNQISALHDRMYEIEVSKDAEIRQLKQKYEKEMAQQTLQMKRVGDDGKELKDLQIKKFKQSLELREFEIQALTTKHKAELQRVSAENQSLKGQIKHEKQLKEIEIREERNRIKETITTNTKHIQREKTIEIAHYESSLKKMKKEIMNKNLQIQQKQKINSTIEEEVQGEILIVKEEKEKLLGELKDMEEQFSRVMTREKKRLTELAEMEKQNLLNIMESEKDCLKAQSQKLNLLILAKNSQIKRLYQTLQDEKDAFKKENKLLNGIIEDLRSKLKQIQADNLQQIQLLKIKMARLHQSDIKSLQSYYENQISTLLTENRQLSNINTINKEKCFELLQKNDQIRKTYEVEISKQKARVQDLKVKLAALQVQHKEQITSLGTKMELTSQTLLREADQKHKGQAFFEAEKKKFYIIINSKDKEITNINETMEKLKKLHTEEKQQNREEIAELKTKLLQMENEVRQAKKTIEAEFEQRRARLLEQFKKSPDQELLQENKQLRDRIQALEAELFAKKKEIEYLLKENKAMQQELGLKAGFIQTMQLESQAAIEDQKSKMKILMGENEVSLKTYFEERIGSRDRDNASLRQQLAAKQNDIRELIVKYNSLEAKMRSLLEAQDKLEGFYNKVVSMGLDQNLVKNTAELFARYNKNERK